MDRRTFEFSQEHQRKYGLPTNHPWRECPWCEVVGPYAHLLPGGPVPAVELGFTCHFNRSGTGWCLGSLRTLSEFPNAEYHPGVDRVSFTVVQSALRMGSFLTNNLPEGRRLRPCPSGILRLCDQSGTDCRRYRCN